MKLEIYGAPVSEDFATIRIKAEKKNDGSIRFTAVNDCGVELNFGNLFELTSDGRITLFGAVNPKFGFDLDGRGRIKVNIPL